MRCKAANIRIIRSIFVLIGDSCARTGGVVGKIMFYRQVKFIFEGILFDLIFYYSYYNYLNYSFLRNNKRKKLNGLFSIILKIEIIINYFEILKLKVNKVRPIF